MGPSTRLIPAARYLRRSSGLQATSLDHQAAAIDAYAASHGFEIVETFCDADRSGLTLKGRPGLQALLGRAMTAAPGFAAILVFDVSRWGRFQDLDEAGHYEFLCRKAGIAVCYCAEPFENDGSPQAELIKQIKRGLAAEYSRDLSTRITLAKRRLAAKGWLQSGPAPYGYRRALIDGADRQVAVLEAGERKLTSLYRIRLTPGPPAEVETVRAIFRTYVLTGLTPTAIAGQLARSGAPLGAARAWRADRVRHILAHPAYVGDHVHGRHPVRLGKVRQAGPEAWTVVRDAWPALIPRARFDAAQALLARARPRTNAQMLEDLRRLLAARGRLDTGLIDATDDMAKACTYIKRFGGLRHAYALIGYRKGRRARHANARSA